MEESFFWILFVMKDNFYSCRKSVRNATMCWLFPLTQSAPCAHAHCEMECIHKQIVFVSRDMCCVQLLSQICPKPLSKVMRLRIVFIWVGLVPSRLKLPKFRFVRGIELFIISFNFANNSIGEEGGEEGKTCQPWGKARKEERKEKG